MKTNRDIELLFEVGSLRYIPRSWKRFLNSDFENLAEHHFRVAWIAFILAKREKVPDIGRVLQLALVHDIGESRTGDTDYLSRQYVKQFREEANQDVLAETSVEDELLVLLKELESRSSIEAKIVKDADNLDVDFEIKEQEARGNPVGKQWQEQRSAIAKTTLFYTDSAKELWKELQTSNPHDWHKNGKNRYNKGGDLSVHKSK